MHYLHGAVWLEVDAVLVHHEPAKTVFAIDCFECDTGLTNIFVAKERVCIIKVNQR